MNGWIPPTPTMARDPSAGSHGRLSTNWKNTCLVEKAASSQQVSPSVATLNPYPTALMISGRRAGSNGTTTAPMSGVAMMAVRIGKSVTSTTRVGHEEEEQPPGAEGAP